MRKQTARGIAGLAATLVVASGCSGGSLTASTGSGSRPAGGALQSLSSGEQAKAAADKAKGAAVKDGKGAIATSREVVVPLLQKAHDTHSWPSKYDTTGEKIYGRIASTLTDTAFVEKDANELVVFWNACAWTMQLIQETKTQADTKTSTAALTRLSAADPASPPDTGLAAFIQPILSGARLGDLTFANSFVKANCVAGLGS